MNCLIWILLLLGCCGNSGNVSNFSNLDCCNLNRGCACHRCDAHNFSSHTCCNPHCDHGCNNCIEHNGCNSGDNLIQPRMNGDCIAPPPVPNRVRCDECDCND